MYTRSSMKTSIVSSQTSGSFPKHNPGSMYSRKIRESPPETARAVERSTVYETRPTIAEEPNQGYPAESAAEMKELIYLPERHNSLSTCI